MGAIIITLKWLFLAIAIWLSFFFYSRENQNISLIRKYITDKAIINQITSSARLRMGYLLFIFTIFSIWMLVYDFEVEDINKRNSELTKELSKGTGNFENLSFNRVRLIEASGDKPEEIITKDITEFYTNTVLNYFVLKKCGIAQPDDIFIINSAMLREMILNKIPLTQRDYVIKHAKQNYAIKYTDYDCDQMHGQFNSIINDYQNYIITTREILKSTL